MVNSSDVKVSIVLPMVLAIFFTHVLGDTAPAKKARSPSPVSRSVSVSSSRSRSASPVAKEERKHSSSKRSKSSRTERDEDGKRIHKSSSRKHRKSRDDDGDRKSSRRDKKESVEQVPEVTEEMRLAIEAEARAVVAAKVEADRAAEEERIERARNLEKMKKRYENDANAGGITCKSLSSCLTCCGSYADPLYESYCR